MRRLYIISIICSICIGLWIYYPWQISAQLSTIDNTSPSITQDINHVISSSHIDNPLRQGSLFGAQSPDWQDELNILNVGDILWFDQAQNNVLMLIRSILNVLLSFVSLIVLIYLLFEWYKMVVAGTNEEQYKEALWKLKNAAIALAGIALSWLIVTFIFTVLWMIIV